MAIDRSPSNPSEYTFSISVVGRYAGVWCLSAAVLPVIVTRFGLIPVYDSQKGVLSAYAAFFCLLALAYVFSQRHRLARAMFSAQLLWNVSDEVESKASPRVSIDAALLGMIIGSLVCTAIYLWAFEIGRGSAAFPTQPPSSLNAVVLALSYITLFTLPSAALAIVAVREHMQQVLGLSDAEVVTGLPRSLKPTSSVSLPAARPGVAVLATRVSVVASEEREDTDMFLSESKSS